MAELIGHKRIFISYSHVDGALVGPVVRLLRATTDFVFRDADDLRPGQRWRAQVEEALRSADLIVVFWCVHSQGSHEVSEEYRLATRLDKDVLPLLLDSTPLTPTLAEYEWVDFRDIVAASHAVFAPGATAESPNAAEVDEARPRPPRPVEVPPKASLPFSPFRLLLSAAAALAVIIGGWMTAQVAGPAGAPPAASWSLYLLLAVLLSVIVVRSLRKKRWSESEAAEPSEAETAPMPEPPAPTERMASELASVLRQRLT